MRKFLDGVLFGAGLVLSFAAIWTLWTLAMSYFMPVMAESALTATREPEFRKPVEAKSVAPARGPKAATSASSSTPPSA